MEKKAVFFDADGTVCDLKSGTPQSALDAIAKLVENGHQAWLCTGRSRAFVPEYLEKIPFTGMVTAAGCTIEKDGKRLFNKEMTPQEAKLSVEILRKNGLVPVMEGADYMYYDKDEYNNDVDWYAELITETIGEHWRPIRGNEDTMRINKISAKILPGSNYDKACRQLEPYYDMIRHENGSLAGTTVEMLPKGYHKAVGMAAVLRMEGIERENSVCFGDSNNDLPMFEYAGYKVAMGNASKKVIALADFVTSDMFHYGIKEGLEHIGLI